MAAETSDKGILASAFDKRMRDLAGLPDVTETKGSMVRHRDPVLEIVET